MVETRLIAIFTELDRLSTFIGEKALTKKNQIYKIIVLITGG